MVEALVGFFWRFMPKRMMWLLVAMFAAVFVTATALFTLQVLHEEGNQIRSNITKQANVLARNLAATVGDYLLTRDYASIEQMLHRTMEFPEVVAIQVVDERGRVISDVVKTDEGVVARYGQPPVTVPERAEANLLTTDTSLEMWHPVVLGELIGWIRITHSLAEIKMVERRVFVRHSELGTMILSGGLLLLLFSIRKPLSTLAQYTEFANRIDESSGAQMEVRTRVYELNHLGRVLNRASRRLHEQHNAINAALSELERLAVFPEKSPEVVLSVYADGRLQYLNPHGTEMLVELGLRRDQYARILPENHPSIVEHSLKHNVAVHAIEAKYEGRALLWTYAPVTSQQTVHCYAVEVTEKKQAEQLAASARIDKESADAANRAKSAFLANMSHEIRTPLTAIIGFSESLLDPQQTAEERTDAVNTVIRAGRHLLHLINEILDLSKVEAQKLEIEYSKIALFDVLDDVVALAGMQANNKGVALELVPVYPLPATVVSDPVRLKQILLNLLGNAVKFTEHGKVTMRVELLVAQRLMRIDIVDTGIGIAPDKLQRLFKPFGQADSSTTRRFGGTGLGLYLARLLAEKLGGTITVSSEIGKGSTFTCTVGTGDLTDAVLVMSKPAKAEQLANVVPARTAALEGNVLLVEDNKDNQRLVSMYLRKLGATVTIANDGTEAVDQALARPFDLILMDMQMPVMDGIEAVKQLRANHYSGPIVALTAGTMASEIQQALDAGCNGFLSKPIEHARFQSTVTGYMKPRAVGTVEPLMSRLLDEDPSFADLVGQFVQRFDSMIEVIAAAAGRKEWAEVKARAHDLKSVGGGYGFPAVSEVAVRIEVDVAQAGGAGVFSLIQQLRALEARIKAGAQQVASTTIATREDNQSRDSLAS